MLCVTLTRRDAVEEEQMRNRNLIRAQVSVRADDYAEMLAGADLGPLFTQVIAAMNRRAGERRRRVFGAPRQTDATEADGLVALTFEAYTEPVT